MRAVRWLSFLHECCSPHLPVEVWYWPKCGLCKTYCWIWKRFCREWVLKAFLANWLEDTECPCFPSFRCPEVQRKYRLPLGCSCTVRKHSEVLPFHCNCVGRSWGGCTLQGNISGVAGTVLVMGNTSSTSGTTSAYSHCLGETDALYTGLLFVGAVYSTIFVSIPYIIKINQ